MNAPVSCVATMFATMLGMMLGLSLLLPSASYADELQDLKARVAALEERLATLEQSLQPVMSEVSAKQLREQNQQVARERMRQDQKNYSNDQLREIEALYQVANKKWRTEEAQQSLQQLIEKYDKANRTGCAILYLGQMSKGDKKLEYLKQAIEHGDCYYGNGVQVGPYARFHLAHHYRSQGKTEEAQKLFAEIRESFPQAIDHKGNRLTLSIPEQ